MRGNLTVEKYMLVYIFTGSSSPVYVLRSDLTAMAPPTAFIFPAFGFHTAASRVD